MREPKGKIYIFFLYKSGFKAFGFRAFFGFYVSVNAALDVAYIEELRSAGYSMAYADWVMFVEWIIGVGLFCDLLRRVY